MSVQSFTATSPCPICEGHPALPQGRGIRCYGFLSDGYAHCTREEHAGALPQHKGGNTYAHRLTGPCRCGLTHGDPAPVDSIRTPRPTKPRTPRLWNVPDEHVELVHPYYDSDGSLAWETIRFAKPYRERYGAKTKPRHRGDDGRWYWGQGRWAGHPAKPLYREAEALAELRLGGHVFFVEGERDADGLWNEGNFATTAGSAGSLTTGQAARIAAAVTDGSDHDDPDVAAIAHATITIIGDDDDAGIKGAAKVRHTLLAACPSLRGRVRALLPPVGIHDVSDWLASAGRSAA
ncbi:MAG: toprim domain-containing protein [Myxococcota bacterium]